MRVISQLIWREKSRCSICELNTSKICANMHEHRKQPLLSTAKFLRRVARHCLAGFGVLAFGLGGGILRITFMLRSSGSRIFEALRMKKFLLSVVIAAA